MTTIEFYNRVTAVQVKHNLQAREAYELAELDYIKKNGGRRYANYDAYYHSNYIRMMRHLNRVRKAEEYKKTVNSLLDKYESRQISRTDFINSLTDM